MLRGSNCSYLRDKIALVFIYLFIKDNNGLEEQEKEKRRLVIEKFQKAPFEEIAAQCETKVSFWDMLCTVEDVRTSINRGVLTKGALCFCVYHCCCCYWSIVFSYLSSAIVSVISIVCIGKFQLFKMCFLLLLHYFKRNGDLIHPWP